jgi:pyridoxine 5-phosphate synthase
MLRLGVNVDHVATLRQARMVSFPDPVKAALLAEKAGADGITAHLREDRRHIQDADMRELAKKVKALNMEMAATDEMVSTALNLKPLNCCIVPEKRAELTTEGGYDTIGDPLRLKDIVYMLKSAGITVSIFIEPDMKQIEGAAKSGVPFIELHTGKYSLMPPEEARKEVKLLCEAAKFANNIGLKVNAGHGINYDNIDGILEIPYLFELNIGHSIIAESIVVGIKRAVSGMKKKMMKYDKMAG